MEHLVVHNVFQCQRRHSLPIEDAADDDGIVRRIESSEHAARGAAAPAQLRAAQQTVEILGIDPLEDLREVAMLPFGPGDELAAANLFDQVRLPADVAPIEVEPVPVSIDARNRLTVQLAEENMGQSLQDRLYLN